jgi:6-phosphogluconolactonase
VEIERFPTAWAVARRGAALIAESARQAVAARDQFLLALSGGKSPWKMIHALAKEAVPWECVHVFQVDERIAPEGHPDRNLTTLREILLTQTDLPEDHIHPMPVDEEDLDKAAREYGGMLNRYAGTPAVLDLVSLGLGSDGHTASLIPEDPVLNVTAQDVAVTEPHFGRNRMTLTYPILNRSRQILWVVTGAEKEPMLKRLLRSDLSIPAGRVNQNNAILLTDCLF